MLEGIKAQVVALKAGAPWLRIGLAVGGVLILLASGIVIGERCAAPRAEVITYRVPVRQADGSLIAERTPEAKPTPAPHEIPRGWKEERRVSATVKPARSDCPPVALDMSIVRDREGGKRVVLSSPDGTVTAGQDIPIEPALVPAPVRRWAAGLAYDPRERKSSAWVERDFARARVGAELSQSGEARLRVGFTF
jgi:hypothetical protein